MGVKSLPHDSCTHGAKDLISTNKQWLLRLCMDLEKQTTPHIKDYVQVENTLKEILKVIDQRVLSLRCQSA
ncbi:MAG: hypothetical protein P4M11_04405 [Candidatus Pacebacteria bacterium]|nr:hypothetical protein [Candidatus Paceibacterota bacterium]